MGSRIDGITGLVRIIFFGTSEFSVPALDALVNAGHDIVGVFCQPPRPAGRGKKLRRSPVQQRAEALGHSIYCPTSLRQEEQAALITTLAADQIVVVAYGLILPPAILNCSRNGCLNIHASLLPRWRGAAPIQRAIMAGDRKTGVCIMKMERGLDTGPILLSETTDIRGTETAGELADRLASIGANLIVRALTHPAELIARAQSTEGVTYAHKVEKAEAEIDWSLPAHEIDCQIRGLSPMPGAWTKRGGERIKILGSQVVDGFGFPSQVLDDQLTVACGNGAIRLLKLQRSGRLVQTARDFLRGYPLPTGTRLTSTA